MSSKRIGTAVGVGLLLLGLVATACDDDGPPGPPPDEVPPRLTLRLAPGERVVLRDTTVLRSFKLEAEPGGAEYRMAVSWPGRSGSASYRLRARGAQARAAGTAASAGRSEAAGVRRHGSGPREAADRFELRLREAMREALKRARARPAGSPSAHRPAVPLASLGAVPPAVGERLRFFLSVQPDFSVDCQDTSRVAEGIVRAVGDRFILAEDLDVAGPLTDAEFAELLTVLDGIVFPVDSAYFGSPADIDGNGRIIALFTEAVNELTPRASSTRVEGFFNPVDLAESGRAEGDGFGDPGTGTCPASNEAELLYLMAPDPGGRFSSPVSVELALASAPRVVAHELQHLLTAEQRTILGRGTFDNLEETWLSEGFAHTAEEVVGIRAAGLSVRGDLRLSEAVTDAASLDAFRTYQLANFSRLRRYYLDPPGTPALATADPSGPASLAMRGFGWSFLRWIADQFAPGPGGGLPEAGEELLFRELSRGGAVHRTGIGNVESALRAVTGTFRSWEDLLADFAIMPTLDSREPGGAAADDGGGEGAEFPVETQLLSWNLPDIFRDLNEERTVPFPGTNPFAEPDPLDARVITMSDGTNEAVEFGLNASTEKIFIVRGPGPTPELFLEVTGPGGAPLGSPPPQLTVVRSGGGADAPGAARKSAGEQAR
ncbi:MAG: hypothetical protein ACE5HP_00120 [Gemmatimonadota bacterium]